MSPFLTLFLVFKIMTIVILKINNEVIQHCKVAVIQKSLEIITSRCPYCAFGCHLGAHWIWWILMSHWSQSHLINSLIDGANIYLYKNWLFGVTVWQRDSVTAWQRDSVTVWQRHYSVTVWQCAIVTVWQRDCVTAWLWQCDSVTVTVWLIGHTSQTCVNGNQICHMRLVKKWFQGLRQTTL
jgi:hypothetical protein